MHSDLGVLHCMQAVLQDARKAYKDGTHKDVALVVDEQEFLPSEG